MKISELAAESGVPLATVKFYLREGLLMPGQAVSRTQADYDQEHVARVKLVKTLSQQPGFSYQLIGRILDLVADEERPAPQRLGEAMAQLPPGPGTADDIPRARALAKELDLALDESSSCVSHLEAALAAPDDVGLPCSTERFQVYWRHIRDLAEFEVKGVAGESSAAASLQHAVVGTAIYEPVLLALRRLAHQQVYSGEL